MLPITTGIVPFGAVMGTVCANAQLSLFQSVAMNFMVFAGASQLAAVDLMGQGTAVLVVLLTGFIINARFILYSAAMSPVVQNSHWLTKLASAYLLTDQNYAVMSAHQERLKSNNEKVAFYFGASVCMVLAWQSSVVAGFVFGNFAPADWALDYAVPLSFVALVVPTFKSYKYILVAAFSSVASVMLSGLPYKLGLIVTALLAIGFGAWLSRRKAVTT